MIPGLKNVIRGIWLFKIPIWPSKEGIITIKTEDEKKYYVEEGTVEFSNNNLLILTSTARDLVNFDKSKIDEMLQKVEAHLSTEISDKDRYVASYKLETLKEIS